MSEYRLYNAAKKYVNLIDEIERTGDPAELMHLEEERARWHNRLIELLKHQGIPFRDREDVTRIAYQIVRRNE